MGSSQIRGVNALRHPGRSGEAGFAHTAKSAYYALTEGRKMSLIERIGYLSAEKYHQPHPPSTLNEAKYSVAYSFWQDCDRGSLNP